MFGPRYRVGWGEVWIILRPFVKEEMAKFAHDFSDPRVHHYTLSHRGYTQQMEEEWFDKTQNSTTDVVWAIQPESSDEVIGITGIHEIDRFHSCHTGIIITDPEWWGKGVASRAHIVRTWYGAKILDRATMQSEVMVPNHASRKALQNVGYQVTSVSPRCRMVHGKFVDSLLLTWFNPVWVARLYPDGVPTKFKRGIETARLTLEKAEKVITGI